MPLCDLHLIALKSTSSVQAFLKSLRAHRINPIIQSRVIRWVILPSSLSAVPLLAMNTRWDLLIVLPSDTKIHHEALSQVAAQWSITAGVPSRLLNGFEEKNASLLNPPPGSVKPPDNSNPITKASTQSLELSPELSAWIQSLPQAVRGHPISMLNLLAFNPGKKEQYGKYGAAFASRVGSRHGGDAKIVGNVVSGQGKEEGWDEIAVAHYPSLRHFAAMIGSRDYQEVNHEHRLGALKDTCILCTMEVGDDGELAGKNMASRL
jgi:hypothetical protein